MLCLNKMRHCSVLIRWVIKTLTGGIPAERGPCAVKLRSDWNDNVLIFLRNVPSSFEPSHLIRPNTRFIERNTPHQTNSVIMHWTMSFYLPVRLGGHWSPLSLGQSDHWHLNNRLGRACHCSWPPIDVHLIPNRCTFYYCPVGQHLTLVCFTAGETKASWIFATVQTITLGYWETRGPDIQFSPLSNEEENVHYFPKISGINRTILTEELPTVDEEGGSGTRGFRTRDLYWWVFRYISEILKIGDICTRTNSVSDHSLRVFIFT